MLWLVRTYAGYCPFTPKSFNFGHTYVLYKLLARAEYRHCAPRLPHLLFLSKVGQIKQRHQHHPAVDHIIVGLHAQTKSSDGSAAAAAKPIAGATAKGTSRGFPQYSKSAQQRPCRRRHSNSVHNFAEGRCGGSSSNTTRCEQHQQ